MNTRIYFNHLPDCVTETDLTDLFSVYGNIVNVHIAPDRVGFVTMITPEGARAAIQSLNGKVLDSGILTLSETPPNKEPVDSTNRRTIPLRTISHLY